MLLCLEARNNGHKHIHDSLTRQIGYLARFLDPNRRSFRDLPVNVRDNITRTLELSYSFTPGYNQAPAISDNLEIPCLKNKLETLKLEHANPYLALDKEIIRFKRNFYENDSRSIAGRAIEAHRNNVIARSKSLTL